MTLVSFVIPNYNHARYVRFAIDSALAQTHPQIEIIVVDDGSTDDSRSVLAEYGDRIRAIFQTNAGLSAARNTGINAARGDYVALLDADDMVKATYVERLLAALADHPQADGAYCGFRFIDPNALPLPRVERRVVHPARLHSALLNGNYWVPESLLIRRDCYLAVGEFDTSLRACEDWDVWLRFSRQYCLVGIADVLICYRVVTGSMSSNPQRMLDNRLSVLRKHVGEQPQGAGMSVAHQAYANACLRGAIEYYQFGDAQTAYACLLDAVRLFPQFLCERSIYYDLACSSQERGSEGEVTQLDFEPMQAVLFGLIDRLSGEEVLGAERLAKRPLWRAHALWALALLHYQAGATSTARNSLLRAGSLHPSLLRNRDYVALLARTAVGARHLAHFKRIKRRWQSEKS